MIDLLDKFAPKPVELKAEVKRPAIDEVFGHTSVGYGDGAFFAQGGQRHGQAPRASRDLARVSELPRRPRPVTTPEFIEQVSAKYRRVRTEKDGPCVCQSKFGRPCALSLLPTQAWALSEMANSDGLFGAISVGDGKTLLNLLSAFAVPGCKVAVPLVPADLRGQLLEIDWEYYGQHWILPNNPDARFITPGRPWLHVLSYNELSSPKNPTALEDRDPDLIICDEAHNLRNRNATRTKRFLGFFSREKKAGNRVRLCCWSGTMTEKSLKDYAHLAALALGEGVPVPLHWPTVEEWASAIDPNDMPSPVGALHVFCAPGEHIHTAFRRRVQDTRGVVASTDESNCNASLRILERKVVVPKSVLDALYTLNSTWQRPDGEEISWAFDKARCARELACGFYYHWVWPRNEPKALRDEWLEKRAAWHKELREKLKFSKPFLDSPLLCAKAAIRFFEGYKGDLPVWNALTWQDWVEIRDKCKPESEAVWIDDFLARDAAEWASKNKGIVWYLHDAFGAKVAELSGAPLYGPGDDASRGLLAETGRRSVVASIKSHHKGKNLQFAFSNQLVANSPSSGSVWEQLLGRTHRRGQTADEVLVHVYRHTPDIRDALETARLRTAYVQGTMGGALKLLKASYEFNRM